MRLIRDVGFCCRRMKERELKKNQQQRPKSNRVHRIKIRVLTDGHRENFHDTCTQSQDWGLQAYCKYGSYLLSTLTAERISAGRKHEFARFEVDYCKNEERLFYLTYIFYFQLQPDIHSVLS